MHQWMRRWCFGVDILINMNTYKIDYDDKFHITGRGEIITCRWEDNNCGDIRVGDTVIIDGGKEYEVRGVEQFMKSFKRRGDNIGILIKPKKSEG